MAEQYFNLIHGCNKSQFSAEQLVRVDIELSDQIQLHCYCPECKITHVLDMSQDSDSSYRKILRRMLVRQRVIATPDEIFDQRRLSDIDMHDYVAQFSQALGRFPDGMVGHRELQGDWEDIILNKTEHKS